MVGRRFAGFAGMYSVEDVSEGRMASLEYKYNNSLHTASTAMEEIFSEVRRVLAPSNFNVLVLGETGTGKEGIARAIHYHSPRKSKPFVAVNCGAITETLAESELFGHEKGAFTGAVERRKGHFEEANGGTIFLDEVEELSPANQARLLRVLQEDEIVRVGSSKPVKVDVRVVAASNRCLKTLIAERKFRDDLFYRLAVETVDLPPLRERTPDIALLADLFAKESFAHTEMRCGGFEAAARARLDSYPWPGNIRELQNAVESSAARCRARLNGAPTRTALIIEADLPSYVSPAERKPEPARAIKDSPSSLKGLRDAIYRLLRECSPQTIGDLAREIGRPRKVIKRQVENLKKDGVVIVRHRKGRLGDEVSLPQ